jgi:hypothetical protein
MADSLIQPFRRNLAYNPVIIPIGVEGIATPVPPMTNGGVTSFKMVNPNPFWVWYRGWTGPAGAMPGVKDMGHYIAPGSVDICRTQMPQFIAAAASAEPEFPLNPTGGAAVTNGDGVITWSGQPCRLVMIYGSGA